MIGCERPIVVVVVISSVSKLESCILGVVHDGGVHGLFSLAIVLQILD